MTTSSPDHDATLLRSYTRAAISQSMVLQHKYPCGSGKSSDSCTNCGEKDYRLKLQRNANSDRDGGESPQIVYDVLRSSGQPLDSDTRAFSEPRFGHDFSRVKLRSSHGRDRTALQRSLVVGAVDDPLEAEADRAADAALAILPGVSTAASFRIQRAGVPNSEIVEAAPRSVSQVLAQSGSPLEPWLQSDMENRFGHDFSHVHIHNDASADKSARDVHAKAYTVGSHIAFAAGHYAPRSKAGRRLIAHELAHVVQQQGGTHGLQRESDQAALDHCIAEQGGSNKYRDGGIANPDELEGYRQECISRQKPANDTGVSRAIANLGRAWHYARIELGAAVAREIESLFSPSSLAMMAAFASVYIASQLTPVGWIADAFALTALSATVIFVGLLAVDIARDLYRFFSAVTASTDEECRASGHALAQALAKGGIGILVALLTRGMRGATRPPTQSAPATTMVEVVATGVGRVRVPVTTTAAEAVLSSRLQSLAAFAVMVPPPGGAEPSSPSSSSAGRGSGERGSAGESRGRADSSEFGANSGLRLANVGYGEGALSQLAQRMRIRLGLRRGGNVAVFEFESVPDRFRRIVERLGGRNTYIEGDRMAVQNVNGSAHSEELAHMLIRTARSSGSELKVKRIYTEYNPCTDSCLPLLRENYPNAEVTYSFIWERWGRQSPDRNAAVDLLFGTSQSSGTRTP